MRILVLGLALAALASPAFAADQFDLVCKYGSTTVRYRIDVLRGEACEAACERIWKMGPATSGELRLVDLDTGDPSEVPQTITVNRKTGALRHWIGGSRNGIVESAVCEPAPFSGFPATKF